MRDILARGEIRPEGRARTNHAPEHQQHSDVMLVLNPGHTDALLRALDLLPERISLSFFADDDAKEIAVDYIYPRVDNAAEKRAAWQMLVEEQPGLWIVKDGQYYPELVYTPSIDEKKRITERIFSADNPFTVLRTGLNEDDRPKFEVTFSQAQLDSLLKFDQKARTFSSSQLKFVSFAKQECANAIAAVSGKFQLVDYRINAFLTGKSDIQRLSKGILEVKELAKTQVKTLAAFSYILGILRHAITQTDEKDKPSTRDGIQASLSEGLSDTIQNGKGVIQASSDALTTVITKPENAKKLVDVKTQLEDLDAAMTEVVDNISSVLDLLKDVLPKQTAT